jgi:hypothetical protein
MYDKTCPKDLYMAAEFCADCRNDTHRSQSKPDKELAEFKEWLIGIHRGWFKSMYGGNCCDCMEPYAKGDPIKRMARNPEDPAFNFKYLAFCCAENESAS